MESYLYENLDEVHIYEPELLARLIYEERVQWRKPSPDELNRAREILGVSSENVDDVVKKKYRDLNKRYHPDRNPGDANAKKRVQEINDAYDILINRKDIEGKYKEKIGKKRDKLIDRVNAMVACDDEVFSNLNNPINKSEFDELLEKCSLLLKKCLKDLEEADSLVMLTQVYSVFATKLWSEFNKNISDWVAFPSDNLQGVGVETLSEFMGYLLGNAKQNNDKISNWIGQCVQYCLNREQSDRKKILSIFFGGDPSFGQIKNELSDGKVLDLSKKRQVENKINEYASASLNRYNSLKKLIDELRNSKRDIDGSEQLGDGLLVFDQLSKCLEELDSYDDLVEIEISCFEARKQFLLDKIRTDMDLVIDNNDSRVVNLINQCQRVANDYFGLLVSSEGRDFSALEGIYNKYLEELNDLFLSLFGEFGNLSILLSSKHTLSEFCVQYLPLIQQDREATLAIFKRWIDNKIDNSDILSKYSNSMLMLLEEKCSAMGSVMSTDKIEKIFNEIDTMVNRILGIHSAASYVLGLFNNSVFGNEEISKDAVSLEDKLNKSSNLRDLSNILVDIVLLYVKKLLSYCIINASNSNIYLDYSKSFQMWVERIWSLVIEGDGINVEKMKDLCIKAITFEFSKNGVYIRRSESNPDNKEGTSYFVFEHEKRKMTVVNGDDVEQLDGVCEIDLFLDYVALENIMSTHFDNCYAVKFQKDGGYAVAFDMFLNDSSKYLFYLYSKTRDNSVDNNIRVMVNPKYKKLSVDDFGAYSYDKDEKSYGYYRSLSIARKYVGMDNMEVIDVIIRQVIDTIKKHDGHSYN